VILVTVGNATQGFRRLLDRVDQLAGENAFRKKEMVFIQSGNNTEFHPLNCKHESFLNMETFRAKIREADLVITHAGAGTLLSALQAGKIPVVMPRRKKYGELVDDHQVELVKALTADGRIIPAYEPEELPLAIEECRRRQASGVRREEKQSPMIWMVADAVDELMNRKRSRADRKTV
jgi:exopolysaccharide biosynthesis glucuronosyltransferase PssE